MLPKIIVINGNKCYSPDFCIIVFFLVNDIWAYIINKEVYEK